MSAKMKAVARKCGADITVSVSKEEVKLDWSIISDDKELGYRYGGCRNGVHKSMSHSIILL